MTKARRDALQERYEQLLDMAETLADSIDEVAYGYSAGFSRSSAIAALESASEVCARLHCMIRDLGEMPVDP